MRKWKYTIIGFLAFLSIWMTIVPSVTRALEIPERPLDTTVVDSQGYLTADTIASIDSLNQTWAATDEQLQVGVYVTESLSGDIESLANETFRHWKVGFSGTNNGVLLVVAIADRKFRIETSDKAATILTDIRSREILDNAKEFFRQEDYNGGISYIVTAIGDQFYGTSDGKSQLAALEEQSSDESDMFPLFLVIILIIIIFGIIDKSSRGGGGPGNLLWMPVDDSHHYKNNHSSSSSSSSFGGGGWSGGGGGGGGASSGW